MKKTLIILLALTLSANSVFAIQDTAKKKQKRAEVTEITLPAVISYKKQPKNFTTMSIQDCVKYAIEHNPNLSVSEQRINAAKSGIGQQRANYAPRLTARVNYNHNDNNGTRVINSHENSLGFNVGISEMIWDFGKTTAKINMAKFDTLSAQYDYDYDLLNITYDVKINYFRVLMALANLDIYEQNVRIQTLNYDRTKAMFDEGLKSKIVELENVAELEKDLELLPSGVYIKKSEKEAGKDIRYCSACFRNYHKLYPIIHGSLRRNCFCSNCNTPING